VLQRSCVLIEFLQRIYFMHINGHGYNPQIMREIDYLALIPGFLHIVQGPANYILMCVHKRPGLENNEMRNLLSELTKPHGFQKRI
jgi:hypothetical protein